MPGEAPLGTLAAWAAFTLLAVVGPGLALQRLLRLRPDPALVLPLGFLAAAAAYRLSLSPGPGWLFPVLVLGLDLALLRRGPRERAPGPGLRGAAAPFLATVALLAATQYGLNRVDAAGDFVADGLQAGDAAFHVGLAFELDQGFPPQVPGLAGVELDYHLGQALLRAAALRWAGVHPYDSLTRFDNTLGALALILALRALAWSLGAGPRGVALVGWTPLFGDLAVLFAWGRGIEWWISLFEGSGSIRSLVEANSLVPALALALGSLVALRRAEAGEGRAWLLPAAALAVAAAVFKVFVAAQLLAGLAVAALPPLRALPAVRRDALARLAAVAVPTGLATLALVVAGGGAVAVYVDPLTVVRQARVDLGFATLSSLGLLAWTPVWLVAALGLRVAGLGPAVAALRQGGAAAAAAVFALSGWLLGLVFRISPLEQGPAVRPFNEALYFFEQSGVVLWVFAAIGLGRLALRGLPARLAAVAVGVALVAPTTVQFAVRKRGLEPMRLHRDGVEAARVLAERSPPGAVVLQRPELQRFPPAPFLVGRRLAWTRFIPFYSQFLPREALLARYETVRAFFVARDAGRAVEVARRLGAGFALYYGRDRPGFDAEGVLEPLYESERARLYRIRVP